MIPDNELGVLILFAQQAEAHGFKFVSIQSQFPDAVIRRSGGKNIKVEFEYKTSNFIWHKHDPRGCDLIICWEHDDPKVCLPTLALSDKDWHKQRVRKLTVAERELAYWKQKALIAEKYKGEPVPVPYYTKTGSMTKERAAEILTEQPDITGAALGRKLGRSESLGRQLKRELLPGSDNGQGR